MFSPNDNTPYFKAPASLLNWQNTKAPAPFSAPDDSVLPVQAPTSVLPTPAPAPILPGKSLNYTSPILQSPNYNRLSNIVNNTPTGLTHPDPQDPSFFRKLARFGEGLGNVVGDILAPGTMQLIPGTQLNRQLQVKNAERSLDQLNRDANQDTVAHGDIIRANAAADVAKSAEDRAKKGEFKLDPNSGVIYNTETGLGLDNKPISVVPKALTGENAPLPAATLDQLQRNLDAQAKLFNINPQDPNYGFKLPANPTVGDLNRLQKQLDTFGTTQATAQQREAQQALQRETEQLHRESLAQTQANTQNTNLERQLKWVQGIDSQGNMVAGPLSQALAEGWHSYAELPSQEVRDVYNARQAVKLASKVSQSQDPTDWGVLQLIDSLDKSGLLGVASSRLNKFMTQGVGASPNDDPRIISLLNKGSLFTTGVMLAHFGAGGGRSPAMLQHFIDLANAEKMDAQTLKSGTKSLVSYMRDRAMEPSTIQAYDEKGVLHQAPAGTALPTGWKVKK